MDFKNRKWRDVPFLILWVMCMLLWIVLLILFVNSDVKNNSSSSSSSSNNYYYQATSSSESSGAILGKIFALLSIIFVAGVLCGFLWLSCMFRWAKHILKFLIGMKLLFWAAYTATLLIVSLIYPDFIGLFVVSLIIFLVMCLYYWCVRRRLRLAAVMIRIGSKIIQMNKKTIAVEFVTSILLVFWYILWLVVLILWIINYQYNGLVGFIMVVMFYWTVNVLTNIAHVTICGVAAVWWFNVEPMTNATRQSGRDATTRGLGSICLGSLLVAIVQTLRAFFRSAAKRGGVCACMCAIFLAFLEWLAKYFSSYVFIQVAMYGIPFWDAAKNTYQLFSSRGIDAIINDNLSGLVLSSGAFVGGILTGLIAIVFSLILYKGEDDLALIAIVAAIAGFLIGYYFTLQFMLAVQSAIKTIFVCWAEDPAALQKTHPKCYQLMSDAWRKVYGHCYDALDTTRDLD